MEKLSYNNIFEAITSDTGEAADLEFRADLLLVLRKIFESRGWTQAQVMEALNIPQPRASELARGKVDKFSADKLIGFLALLGYRFKPTFNNSGDNSPVLACSVMQAA